MSTLKKLRNRNQNSLVETPYLAKKLCFALKYYLTALSLCLQLCAAIWKWSITAETCITNLGDWCKDKEGEEADKFYWASRPSDYMLTHFQLFSEVWCLNNWV